MLNFFLVSLVVGSGIIIGGILSIIAKDELKPGNMYFRFLKNISFSAVMLVSCFYFISLNFWISLFSFIFLGILLVKKAQLIFIYLAFAVVCISSYLYSSSFMLISSLMFFAGFPIGTVAAYDFIKKEIFVERMILIPYFIFVFICGLFSLYSYFYL